MKQSLFLSFKTSGKADWKRQVEKDLKGSSYAELGWKLTDQISVEPYYTADDVADPRASEVRACQKQKPGWLTQPPIRFTNASDTNLLIRKALQSGAEAIWLQIDDQQPNAAALQKALHSIRLTDIPVVFQKVGELGPVREYLQQNSAYQLKGGLATDPLASWMQTGIAFEAGIEQLREVIQFSGSMPDFRPLMVGGHAFQDAGASVVQELAFTLASAVEYLDRLTDTGLSAQEVVGGIWFSLSMGTEYLLEIAKLRALRYLLKRVTDTWQVPAGSHPVFIHARNSSFYDAMATPHTNMIRATSEAMSAAVGGCDALSIYAYDESFRQPGEFSNRIARNISLILKEEGYLDKVADPAAGSYYLEVLTLQLADAAWELFLEVEEKGGLVKAFEQDFIQNEIQQSWNKKRDAVKNGKIVVGVTKYRSEDTADLVTSKKPVVSRAENNGIRVLPVYQLGDTWE